MLFEVSEKLNGFKRVHVNSLFYSERNTIITNKQALYILRIYRNQFNRVNEKSQQIKRKPFGYRKEDRKPIR